MKFQAIIVDDFVGEGRILQVLFDDKNSQEMSLEPLLQLLLETLSTHRLEQKVLFDLLGAEDQDLPELESLVCILHDYGIQTILHCSGYSYPPIIRSCRKNIVTVCGVPWIGYRADSVIYQPDATETLKEPLVRDIHRNSTLILHLTKRRNPATVLSFTATAKNPWRISSPPQFTYPVVVIGGKP